MGYYPAYIAQSMTDVLAYPHYSDSCWNHAQLIYGTEQRCQNVNYNDRLYQWDYAMAERASYVVKLAGLNGNTAQGVEAWLTFYHDTPIILRYIMAGSNLATGYPYYVYGYDFTT